MTSIAAPIELFGVRLVGLTGENGRKLVLSIVLIAIVVVARRLLRRAVEAVFRGDRFHRLRFWTRQSLGLIAAVVLIVGLVSLWFDEPSRLTTALGLFTAGPAFSPQPGGAPLPG